MTLSFVTILKPDMYSLNDDDDNNDEFKDSNDNEDDDHSRQSWTNVHRSV